MGIIYQKMVFLQTLMGTSAISIPIGMLLYKAGISASEWVAAMIMIVMCLMLILYDVHDRK